MKNNIEELLSIYERFGSKAQEALDFVKRNMKPAEAVAEGVQSAPGALENGVYIVYNDGGFAKFDGGNSKDGVAMIGVAYDGHTFGVPLDHDYGQQRLLKEDEYPSDEHCVDEVDALINWDFVGETEYLKRLGLAFELKEGHYLPTAPVFLAQYAHREQLNQALAYMGAKEMDFASSRWFCQRYYTHHAWFFHGSSRSLSNGYAYYSFQVVAVSLWQPN